MMISNAPCSWGVTGPSGNRYGWAQYLDEVAAAGYGGTELGPFGYMPTEAAILRDELARRGLALVGATHVHRFRDPAGIPHLMMTLRRIAPLLAELGAGHLAVMDDSDSYRGEAERDLGRDGWAALKLALDEAAALVEDEHGLRLSFHPHIGTGIEKEAQIDRMLDITEVALCFDTGHHAVWDQDPIAYMVRVWDRIAYMHLKNVDGAVRGRLLDGELAVAESYGAGIMCPLPDGVVDIRAVMRMLEDRGFAGPVVVEQDVAENAELTPVELARINLDYLRSSSQ
jgi:inosose dehydratase